MSERLKLELEDPVGDVYIGGVRTNWKSNFEVYLTYTDNSDSYIEGSYKGKSEKIYVDGMHDCSGLYYLGSVKILNREFRLYVDTLAIAINNQVDAQI